MIAVVLIELWRANSKPFPVFLPLFPTFSGFLGGVALLFQYLRNAQNFPGERVFKITEANQARKRERRYATTNHYFADVCSVGIGICFR